MQLATGRFAEAFGKNTVYRFLSAAKTNWVRFVLRLSERIINRAIRPLTGKDRKDVFIIDDTLFARTGGKKTELCSRVFDHVSMRYRRGYRLLTLGWSDGNSFLPITGRLLASNNDKQIFAASKKRRGRSKYLLSVDVTLTDREGKAAPARIVCVRNRNNRKDWITFISTDVSLSPEEILRIYGKCWEIDVFFKTCKSMLRLGSECHCLSCDALNARVSLVFVRYMLLWLQKRCNEDDRTIGELFLMMVDELADTTFARAMQLIVDAMLQIVREHFGLSEEQLLDSTRQFYDRLTASYHSVLLVGGRF